MAPNLILGPLLRHVGPTDASVWVETDFPCEVEVIVGGSSHRLHAFSVEGHHYALVRITDLEPDSSYEYSIRLDGAWVTIALLLPLSFPAAPYSDHRPGR